MRATQILTLALGVAVTTAALAQATKSEQKTTSPATAGTAPAPVAAAPENAKPTAAQPAAATATPATNPASEPVAMVTAATVVPGTNGTGATAAQVAAPQAIRMEPRVAKPGTVITISGVSLGKKFVDEVYLTDHRFDMKVKVLEQSENTLKIRVPPFLKPGRQQLLLLTSGEVQSYLEQPFYVQIESKDDEEKEVAQAPVKESSAGEKGAANGSNSPENR